MGQKTQDKNSKNWKNRRRKFRQKRHQSAKKSSKTLDSKKTRKNEPQEKICQENRFTNCRENDMMKNDILLQFLPALSGRDTPGKGFPNEETDAGQCGGGPGLYEAGCGLISSYPGTPARRSPAGGPI
ncbi:MAG: hypothetical protein ACLUFL_01350 [Flavonifractor plautii]